VLYLLGGSLELRDGWRRRKNAITVLTVAIPYSGEYKGAAIARVL